MSGFFMFLNLLKVLENFSNALKLRGCERTTELTMKKVSYQYKRLFKYKSQKFGCGTVDTRKKMRTTRKYFQYSSSLQLSWKDLVRNPGLGKTCCYHLWINGCGREKRNPCPTLSTALGKTWFFPSGKIETWWYIS